MAKKSVSDLSFEFSDDGELELSGYDEDTEFEDDEILEDEEEVEETEDDEEVDEIPDVTSRIDSLEKTIQALPQMISTAIASALGGRQQKQEDDEDDDNIPDELDNKQIVNILAKRMQKAVKSEVGSAIKDFKENDPAVRDARITAEFQRANAKYGQKFRDRMVPIAKIIQKSNGAISVEDAYLSIADIPIGSKQPNKLTKSGKAPKSVKVDADSDDSVGDINQQNPRPKLDIKKIKEVSDTDMFQYAWNKSLMSHARAGRRRR
jgi:hypothetical protein